MSGERASGETPSLEALRSARYDDDHSAEPIHARAAWREFCRDRDGFGEWTPNLDDETLRRLARSAKLDRLERDVSEHEKIHLETLEEMSAQGDRCLCGGGPKNGVLERGDPRIALCGAVSPCGRFTCTREADHAVRETRRARVHVACAGSCGPHGIASWTFPV